MSLSFQDVVLPHLDAAYALARWITRQPQDAEDVVQEALVRAMKYFSSYRGGSAKSWLLTIVRNTSYSWLQRRPGSAQTELSEELPERAQESTNPETLLLKNAHRQKVQAAIRELPLEFREVVVLRELEGLGYKDIAAVVGVPIGTVMSRLARARGRLQESLGEMRTSL